MIGKDFIFLEDSKLGIKIQFIETYIRYCVLSVRLHIEMNSSKDHATDFAF